MKNNRTAHYVLSDGFHFITGHDIYRHEQGKTLLKPVRKIYLLIKITNVVQSIVFLLTRCAYNAP